MADIPAGTGLGSSGSFVPYPRQRNVISPHALAEQACPIEIDLLHEPVGKQDQFIAAYGGVRCFELNKNDSVAVTASAISHEVLDNLEDGLCLFITGYTRSASDHPEGPGRQIEGKGWVNHRQFALHQGPWSE
jgi:D-glycero-alpha-D-manno-heptose-7-phosphate kinase